MKTKLLALMLTTALASPAFAQAPAAPAGDTAPAATTEPAAPAEAAGGGFVSQQAPDQWRASELIGTNVYGPDDASIGSISDVLVGRDGQVDVAIVGVGGFLGIGQKDVGIPFGDIEWRFSEPQTAGTGGGTPPAGGTASAPAEAPAAPASTTEAPAGVAAPDRAYVTYTKEDLDQAPAFVNLDDDENPANPEPAATDAPAAGTTEPAAPAAPKP